MILKSRQIAILALCLCVIVSSAFYYIYQNNQLSPAIELVDFSDPNPASTTNSTHKPTPASAENSSQIMDPNKAELAENLKKIQQISENTAVDQNFATAPSVQKADQIIADLDKALKSAGLEVPSNVSGQAANDQAAQIKQKLQQLQAKIQPQAN